MYFEWAGNQMIEKICNSTIKYFGRTLSLSEDEKIIYQFCLEALLSKLLFIIVILLFGVLTKRIIISLLYISTLAPLRSFGGGAHLSTRLKCNLLSYSISFFSILLCPVICKYTSFELWSILFILFLTYTLFRTPVDTKNKRFKYKLKENLKTKYQQFVLVLSFVFFVLLMLEQIELLGIITICVIIFSIGIIIGTLQNKREFSNDF